LSAVEAQGRELNYGSLGNMIVRMACQRRFGQILIRIYLVIRTCLSDGIARQYRTNIDRLLPLSRGIIPDLESRNEVLR
jgi:hypothetical protein